jgi:hypothetical protein
MCRQVAFDAVVEASVFLRTALRGVGIVGGSLVPTNIWGVVWAVDFGKSGE